MRVVWCVCRAGPGRRAGGGVSGKGEVGLARHLDLLSVRVILTQIDRREPRLRLGEGKRKTASGLVLGRAGDGIQTHDVQLGKPCTARRKPLLFKH